MDIRKLGNDISKSIDIADSVLGKAKTIKDEIEDQYQDYEAGCEYGRSEQYKRDLQKTKRIENRMVRRQIFFVLLWITMIVVTIVLCVTGNDCFLRLLKL